MKFIDKTLNKVNGNQLVDDFLNSRWDINTNNYSLIDYKSPAFNICLKSNLRLLLLSEQDFHCCYCMRIIEESNTTLEHIIPKSTSTQTIINQYTHHQIIRDNVCLQSIFDNAVTKQNTPPYPLQIAYENLTASCNGVFSSGPTYQTCNHFRKNNIIEPFFYISGIETDIIYRKAGIMDSSDNTINNSIITLNLNYDSLEQIRQVWYHLSVENLIDIENVKTEFERNETLTLNLINLSDTRKRNQLIADFKTETFWNILLQYKWFHNYYKTKYPIASR